MLHPSRTPTASYGRSSAVKRAALVVLTAVSFVACTDQREPTRSTGLSADISDANNTSPGILSNPHFFWLPPLVAAPSPTGVFNPRLSPVVQICSQLVTPCTQVHATFTTTTGPGSQTVRVDVANQLYIVNWKTSGTTEPVGSSFRIAVLAHNRVLGFADVEMVGSGKMKNAYSGDDVPLVDGSTLAIKFRIEEGALSASCANGSLDCVEQTAFPDKDNIIITNGNQAGTFIPAGALSQLVTVAIIENTSKPCIPPPFALPQYFPEPDQKGCYDFFTDPGPTVFNVTPDNPVIVAICVETGLDPGTTGRNIQLFQFDEGQPVRALTPHSAAFMPCEPDPYQEVIGSRGQGLRRVFAVAKARLHRVLSYFAPASLHAAHLGVGGSSGSYSRMTWSILAQMDKNSADPQAAAVGTPVAAPPQVLLRDTSTVHNPVAGVTVTFTVDGGGSIANSVVVTGRDGTASVGTWTLGPTPGANHVIATADGALGSPVTFTATGFSPVLYAVNASDDGLSTIDPATGAEAFVGRLGGTNLNLYTTPVAMAVHVRDGVIFVWNNSGDGTSDAATGDLLNVDRCSGLATKINASPTGQDIGALAFAHDTLYGARDIFVGGALSSQLVLVDTSSGLTTPKGSGVGLRLGGMDANAGGTLYGLELTTAATQRLVTIDKSTGVGTVVATLSQDVGVSGSIVFSPSGTLFGTGFGGPQGNIIFQIDPATGTVSSVHTVTGGFAPQGLGFAPACGAP